MIIFALDWDIYKGVKNLLIKKEVHIVNEFRFIVNYLFLIGYYR